MNTYQAPATKSGFRKLLQELSAATALSFPEISKRSGVHFTSIYNILREAPGDNGKHVRPSTVRKIAESLGYRAQFSSSGNQIVLKQAGPAQSKRGQKKMQHDALEAFGQDLADLLRSLGYKDLDRGQKTRIKEMVRLMLPRR